MMPMTFQGIKILISRPKVKILDYLWGKLKSLQKSDEKHTLPKQTNCYLSIKIKMNVVQYT